MLRALVVSRVAGEFVAGARSPFAIVTILFKARDNMQKSSGEVYGCAGSSKLIKCFKVTIDDVSMLIFFVSLDVVIGSSA